MSSFHSIGLYSPFLVFIIGCLTLIGFLGFGLFIQRLFRLVLPSPWKEGIAYLAGIQSFSLIIQVLAMTGAAFRSILVVILVLVWIVGLLAVMIEYHFFRKIRISRPGRLMLIPLIVILIALFVNLIAAIAPSTKCDELYYHMLLPARILSDHALHFYRYPWECGVMPHMIFQISLTPLHALGFPDAGNVVSWGLSAMLLIFGWTLLCKEESRNPWDFLFLSTLVIGMYPVIWHVTGGSYAMGDLAMAMATVALLLHEELIRKLRVDRFSLVLSFLILCSVSSKVSMIPLGMTMAILGALIVWNNKPNRGSLFKCLIIAIVPWLVFYFPMLIWTFIHSGSPFGPLMAGFMNAHSVYDLDMIRLKLAWDRSYNIPTLFVAIWNIIIYSSPLFWGAVILLIFPFRNDRCLRLTGLILFLVQTLVLLVFLIFDPRYYGGLLQGLVIVFILIRQKYRTRQKYVSTGKLIAGMIIFIIPWLGMQVFYGWQFFPVSLGIEDKTDFYREKIPFYDDFSKIDKIIQEDAVFLYRGAVRLNAVFAPRPVFMDGKDVPIRKKVYLFQVDGDSCSETGGYKVGKLLYLNNNAIIESYRNPFRQNKIGRLKIYALVPEK